MVVWGKAKDYKSPSEKMEETAGDKQLKCADKDCTHHAVTIEAPHQEEKAVDRS